MKRIHLTIAAALSISCVTAACVDSAPVAKPVADAGTDGGKPTTDSGADSSAPTDSGLADAAVPWSPKLLTGLSLWLDAQKGVTGTTNVTTWADQSGQGNDFSQAAAANQPSLTPNAQNSLNALEFTAANDTFIAIQPLPASLAIGAGDFAVVEVLEWDNIPMNEQQKGYACLFVPGGTTGFFANDPFIPNASVYAQVGGAIASTATTLNDGHYHYVAMRRTGTTLESRADGVGATAPVSAADFTASSIGAFIGGRIVAEAAHQSLDGHIAEVIVVNGTLSDPDLATLETYLKTKYAL